MRTALLKRLEAGRQQLVSGRFHQAHDAFERVWRRSQGSEKLLVQALVLWAAALHHRSRDRYAGSVRLLARAVERCGRAHAELPFDAERLSDALTATWEAVAEKRAELALHWPFHEREAPATADLAYARACPYCGAAVTVWVEPELLGGSHYVEDCPVCCQPWEVQVQRDDGEVRVSLGRDDD